MINFQPLTLQDIPRITPYFSYFHDRTCDFTVGGMFMWRSYFHMEYALHPTGFYSRLYDENGQVFYNLPLAPRIGDALTELAEWTGGRLRFCTIPESYLPLFQDRFPGCQIEEQRDYFDYLYRADDLTTLAGKKYSPQRNRIHQFERSVDTWQFDPITPRNVSDVEAFFLQSYTTADRSSSAREENLRVLEVLRNLELYQMHGGVLWADGHIVGFSLGEILHDTLYTHIEKADRTCKGAYQMLTHQFAMRYAGNGVQFINREEDMGDPGLRRAKSAYHPVTLLKKFVVGVGSYEN